MHLIELFLPLADNLGMPFTTSIFASVESELSDKFGGVTTYPRTPASGVWKKGTSKMKQDELVVYEIMAEKIDLEWWKNYRKNLEQLFHQERILIRSREVQLL